MPYALGDRVTVRNRGATWPGTVAELRDAPWGAVYRVNLSSGGEVDVPERMLAPRPHPPPKTCT